MARVSRCGKGAASSSRPGPAPGGRAGSLQRAQDTAATSEPSGEGQPTVIGPDTRSAGSRPLGVREPAFQPVPLPASPGPCPRISRPAPARSTSRTSLRACHWVPARSARSRPESSTSVADPRLSGAADPRPARPSPAAQPGPVEHRSLCGCNVRGPSRETPGRARPLRSRSASTGRRRS